MGYIGSHTAIQLANLNYQVVLFDNLSNSKKDVINRINKLASKEVSFVFGDVTDTGNLVETIKKYQIDSVIHFAGLKAVGESNIYPIDYFKNNISGTISLIDAMNITGVKTLIFSSSATVYGEPQYLPIDELHGLGSMNPYGRTKLHIEELLNDISNSDSEWKIICLRYFNPVGAHESGLIGEDPKDLPNNLMPIIAKVAKKELPSVRVFGNDYDTIDGTGVRDYIHVEDLASGHIAALKFLSTEIGIHFFNLGTGMGFSVLEIINAYKDISKMDIPYEFFPRRKGDVASCYADTKKAYEQLHWEVKYNLEDMCRTSWKFVQENSKT